MKTFVATLVSAMMALPAPSWAIDPAGNSGEAKDGPLPAVVVSAPTPDGKGVINGFWVPVPVSQEAAFADAAIRQAPDSTILVVNGPNDPLLKTAAATGYLPRLKTFLVGRFQDSPFARAAQVPRALKSKVGHEIQRLNAFVASREGKWAVAATFSVSGTYGVMTYLQSSHVDAGAAVFGAYLMWAGFQMLFEHHWQRALDGGGELMKSAVRSLFYSGQMLTEAQARIFSNTGSLFAVVIPVNFVLSSWILTWAGQFQSPLQALGLAIVASNDIIDKISGSLVERKKIPNQWRLATTMTRIFLGTVFEVASYVNVPGVQVGMTGVTMGALVWLFLGQGIQDGIFDGVKMSFVKVGATGRAVASGLRGGANRCRSALLGWRKGKR